MRSVYLDKGEGQAVAVLFDLLLQTHQALADLVPLLANLAVCNAISRANLIFKVWYANNPAMKQKRLQCTCTYMYCTHMYGI